jgi:hypothetical protein
MQPDFLLHRNWNLNSSNRNSGTRTGTVTARKKKKYFVRNEVVQNKEKITSFWMKSLKQRKKTSFKRSRLKRRKKTSSGTKDDSTFDQINIWPATFDQILESTFDQKFKFSNVEPIASIFFWRNLWSNIDKIWSFVSFKIVFWHFQKFFIFLLSYPSDFTV